MSFFFFVTLYFDIVTFYVFTVHVIHQTSVMFAQILKYFYVNILYFYVLSPGLTLLRVANTHKIECVSDPQPKHANLQRTHGVPYILSAPPLHTHQQNAWCRSTMQFRAARFKKKKKHVTRLRYLRSSFQMNGLLYPRRMRANAPHKRKRSLTSHAIPSYMRHNPDYDGFIKRKHFKIQRDCYHAIQYKRVGRVPKSLQSKS